MNSHPLAVKALATKLRDLALTVRHRTYYDIARGSLAMADMCTEADRALLCTTLRRAIDRLNAEEGAANADQG